MNCAAHDRSGRAEGVYPGRTARRGVLRVAASYGAIAWLLIQIAGTVAEPLELPRWASARLIFTVVLGFPVAVGLAWFLEFTPQGRSRRSAGRRRAATSDRRAPPLCRPGGHRRAGAGGRLPGRATARRRRSARRATVAVLPFENVGTVADGRYWPLGIAESVLHQLANLQQLDVISRTSSFNFRGTVRGCARDRPAAQGKLPARGQRAAGSHAAAHHYATDRCPDRCGRVVDAL